MKLSRNKILAILTIALLNIFAIGILEVQAAAPKLQGRVIDQSDIGIEGIYMKWTGEDGGWRYAPSDANGYFLFYGWSEYHELANSWPCSGGMLMSQGACGSNVWYGSKCSDGTSLTKAACTAGGGYWISFVCSDGTSVTETECGANGGYWYGEWGVSAGCNQFSDWRPRDTGGDRIIINLESMLTVRPDWSSSSNKTHASCPPTAGSPATCDGGPCVCPNNIPASIPTNCFDPGPPETLGFNFNPRGDFGCLTSHVVEPVLPATWHGHFEPDRIEFLFPGMTNNPDIVNAGFFRYIKAECGDGIVQTPNDDNQMEECDSTPGCDPITCQEASCDISLSPVTINGEGGSGTGTVTIIPPPVSLQEVEFGIPTVGSNSNSVAQIVGSNTDLLEPFTVQIQSLVNVGNTTYSAVATVDGGTTTCTATGTINITAESWWQVDGGDVMTNGSISSEIPSSCIGDPGCDPYIVFGNPAIPIEASSSPIDYGGGEGPSSSNWEVGGSANTRYAGEPYDYDFFQGGFPSGTSLSNPDIELATFDTCPEDGSYCYYYYDGSQGTLNITEAIDLGEKKVILLVEGVDTNIQGNIEIEDGKGFFMVVADQNITLEGSVDYLEGIYVADEYVETCSANCSGDDVQLVVDGVVVAWRQVILQRDLGIDNNPNTPGELFRNSPEQVLLIPQLLTKSVDWVEVEP